VEAILADFESATIDERLRETLRFLQTMTLRPGELDASRALAAGVSREALRDAAYVAAAFNLIDRFADAIGAQPGSQAGLSPEQVLEHGGRFLERGYV
jgi:alkylhydroperoxidase family enzyme